MASPTLLEGDGPYDVIFCRNAFIYFNAQTRNTVVRTLSRLLTPGGTLFVGSSETGALWTEEFHSAKIPMAFAFLKAADRLPHTAGTPTPTALKGVLDAIGKDLKQIKTVWKSPLEPWKDAYAHEKMITAKIHSLIKIARKENDYTAEPLLAWFANEQIEEESNTDKVCRQLEMVGENKQGLFMLDRELGTRIFVAGSPFDPAAYNLLK